jgi:uncharacterized SAM-binding protein YcdF (DUF218 family)
MDDLESRVRHTGATRRRRLLQAALAAALLSAVLYAASTPLLTALGGLLIRADQPERVDTIVVLASSFDRVIEAAELYRAGYAPLVLLTRETRQPGEQSLIDRGIIEGTEERRRAVLVALGVPPDATGIIDGFAGSTADEARLFAGWVQQHPIRSVMIVTSPYHTYRSQVTFQRALERLDVRVLVRPSRLGRFRADRWWQSRDTLRDGVLELQRLIYYRLVELRRLTPAAPAASGVS